MLSYSEKQDRVQAIITRYVTGELSQLVFEVSLRKYIGPDEIRHLVMLNHLAHRNSLPFKRGEIS